VFSSHWYCRQNMTKIALLFLISLTVVIMVSNVTKIALLFLISLTLVIMVSNVTKIALLFLISLTLVIMVSNVTKLILYFYIILCLQSLLLCDALRTVRRSALLGLCDRNSVCPSVRLSVCHTRALCPHVRPMIMISSPYGSPLILVSGDILALPYGGTASAGPMYPPQR